MLDKIQEFARRIVGHKYTTEWDRLNYAKIPVTIIPAKLGNEAEYNKLYKMLIANKRYKPIQRTQSGGVSISCARRFTFNQFDARQLGNTHEITLVTLEFSCRIQWRIANYKNEDKIEKTITASAFFRKYWLPECKKHGIDMKKYAEADGFKYKESIHKADIALYDPAASYGWPIENAYHLDFHKFYPSGLCIAHPEFRPVIEHFNELARTDKMFKTGIDSMIGYFQSKCCGYRYAKLSMDAINAAYEKFDEVKALLKGRIIATNTDGIWYKGPEFHGLHEGPGLGQWSTDHKACRIRFKSAGSYEYIENGAYTPIVRGSTRLDRILDRSEWEWGDIFAESADLQLWKFQEGEGIIWQKAD